ncbi:PP2C family protein-serine/threonine phosphatase [Cellulomonas oligotrophica]|uniref:Histidine kinase n=1 Tax=Cellulomonas oligotrophica TaxID=931536 RepID=A0A7Y9JY19_9CELL|nr:SpoIIE family protein phosphatase [Cellulomonas oligotrophica]NYD87363.1 sigma-B regulation protein RsbU (phosphoserine phosphatase) [Cellulomonas oligotrophica]GIG34549.1 histidine kinase [Cellulomonas oligotrophica]
MRGPEDPAFQEALHRDDPGLLDDHAPIGYLSTTPDGLIVRVNATFLTWTGHRREDLVGRRRFVDLLPVGGRLYHETHYAPTLRMQGSAREIALEVVCADGRRLPVLVNSVLDRDADGTPRVIRTAVLDATERRRYEQELLAARRRAEESEARAVELAQTLQQTLIPPTPPHIPGLDVAAAYRPAGDGRHVGGDFYDVFQVATDDWVVALGDVQGKGAEAAVVTALARYTVRAASVDHDAPSAVLRTLDRVLRQAETDRFCTVALVRLRRTDDSWRATIACGGHPLPLLRRAGRPPEPVGTHGPLVGILPRATFTDTDVDLAPGDALVLFTDGVPEGRRGRDFYGPDRLLAVVDAHRGPAADVTDAILADAMAFQSDEPRDDIAVVTIAVA